MGDPGPLLARGLAVFPLPPGGKTAGPGWWRTVTTDPAAVAAWPDGANTGVSCRASGLVVLDLDRHPGGADGIESFRWLCARARAPWPSTYTVATPTNQGLHLYFTAPPGGAVSSIGRWPGIDVRGPGLTVGGYVAAAGSSTSTGLYTVKDDVPIAALPRWLRPLLPRR